MTRPSDPEEIFSLLSCEDCGLVLYIGNGLAYRQCYACDRYLKPGDRVSGTIDTLIAHARRHGLRADSTEIQRILASWRGRT